MLRCDAARTLEPYLERVTQVLERLELLVQRIPREGTPVPTPPRPTQQTTVRYNIEAYGREAEARPLLNHDTLGSDGFDSASSRGATPRGPSPQREGTAGTSLSVPGEASSSDEMETWHSAPLPYYERAAAGMARINTYYNVRLADIEGVGTIVHQGHEGSRGTTESTTDDHKADSSYRYDTLAEPPARAAHEQPATISGDIPSTRLLKDWIDDIHGRGGTPSEDGSWPIVPSPITTAGCVSLHIPRWTHVGCI